MSICSHFKPTAERHPCLVFNRARGPQLAQLPSTPTRYLSLFSLNDRLIHTLTPPVFSVCIGAGEGWLVLSDLLSDLSLFNPLTNVHLPNLPKLSTLPHVTANHDPTTGRIRTYSVVRRGSREPLRSSPESLVSFFVDRALVVPDPSAGGTLTIVLHLSVPSQFVAWAKPGDERWTMVEKSFGFLDVICHKDHIFTAMCNSAVLGYGARRFIPVLPKPPDVKFLAEDLTERRGLENMDKQKLITLRKISFFLASSPSGDLLRVRKERIGSTHKWRMTVHKVMVDDDESGPGSKLVEVKDLGENAILLGGSAAVCVSAVGVPELKPNMIYFAEGSTDGPWTEAGIYSMEDGSIEPLLPSMMPPHPLPSWIMISHA